jgi:Acetyltransferase (GNAT) domain
MRPRPLVPDGFDVPATLEHERFRLRMLSVDDVVKDFEAINARVAPDGSPDPWSETTLTENLVDLGWHQKEFQLCRSFAYTVVSRDERTVLGCVYVNPSDEADAEVRLWVRQEAWDEGLDVELERAVRAWIADEWPFERVDWRERAREGRP